MILHLKPRNPYTVEEEHLWQFIVGWKSRTTEHVMVFEWLTGKRFNENYLY